MSISKTYLIFGLVFLLLIIQPSCIKVPLKKEFESFNPYSKGDVLVFKSQNKITSDTLYVIGVSKFYYDGVMPLFSKNCQGLSVNVCIENYFDTKRPLNSMEIFMIIPKDKIGFYLTLNKDIKFYSVQESNLNLELYKKIVTKEFFGKVYTDVIVIENNSPYLDERKNLAKRAYWSLSQGYLALEMKDGEKYELVKKYRDEIKCNQLKKNSKTPF